MVSRTGADAVVRLELPEQRRPLAVPADREREPAERRRQVVHLPALAQPAVGHDRAQRQPVVELLARGGPARRARSAASATGSWPDELERSASGGRASRRWGRIDRGERPHVGRRPGLAGGVEQVGDGGQRRRRAVRRRRRAPSARRRAASRSTSPCRAAPIAVEAPVIRSLGQRGPGRVRPRRAGAAERPRPRSPSGRAHERPAVPRRRAAGSGCWRRSPRGGGGRGPRCGRRRGCGSPNPTRPAAPTAARPGRWPARRRRARRRRAAWRCGRAGTGARRARRRRRQVTDAARTGSASPASTTSPASRASAAVDSANRPGERARCSAGAPSTSSTEPASDSRSTRPPPSCGLHGQRQRRPAPCCRSGPPPRGRPRRAGRGRRRRATRRRRWGCGPASPPPGWRPPAAGGRPPPGPARCQRSSAPIHQSSDQPAPSTATRPAGRPSPAARSRGCRRWSRCRRAGRAGTDDRRERAAGARAPSDQLPGMPCISARTSGRPIRPR